MKQQVAISLAGLMLLTSGCENTSGKVPLGMFTANLRPIKAEKGASRDVSERNVHNQWQGKSAPSLYDGGLFIRADFLYWRASEEGLQYAIRRDSSATPSSHIYSPEIEWNAGFRIGVGYTISRQDYWDLFALWTHFNTDQSDHKSSKNFDLATQSGTALLPWRNATTLGSFADKASVKWNLAYNIYDLSLGRGYFVAKTFSVHPFVGLRGATIHQNYHAHYKALLPTSAIVPTSFRATNNFWGIGLHAGTDLEWHFNAAWSLVGNVGGSLLYGDFHDKEKFVSFTGVGVERRSNSLHEHVTTGATNLEGMLGFQWERFFHHDKRRLALTLGYEWSQWYSQNRMTRVDLIPSAVTGLPSADHFDHENGDLTLQGMNFQARFDF